MRQVVEFGRLLELKNNEKSLNFPAQKVVAVVYKRFKLEGFDWESFGA